MNVVFIIVIGDVINLCHTHVGTEDQCEPQPIPSLLVGYDKDWLALSPFSIKYWVNLPLFFLGGLLSAENKNAYIKLVFFFYIFHPSSFRRSYC